MARFALFLVRGNSINLLEQAIAEVAALYMNGNEFYIVYTLVVISLILTPCNSHSDFPESSEAENGRLSLLWPIGQ